LNSRKVALHTLGCKVNQVESSHFLEVLAEAGYGTAARGETADLTIVHSCAVTSRASLETRQLLRRARRANPRGEVVVVMGCDVHVEAPRLAAEQLATHILGNGEKFDLLQWLREPGTFQRPCVAAAPPRSIRGFRELCMHRMAIGRSRAVLKVQDGCDAFCSYCIVPHSRGCSRSLPARAVRGQLHRFMEQGFQEVVLSGIHLGQWGRDLDARENLTSLLRQLKCGGLPPRIRLSSLEPLECTEGLMGELQTTPELCPHFHIPLQSGDDDILEAMHRPYGAGYYRDLILHLHDIFPDAAIGADVLAGFPGETESRFQNTLSLLSDLPIAYLHVFPFSPRPGTLALQLSNRIDGHTLKARCRVLRELSARKRIAFAGRFLGRTMELLVERRDPRGFLWQGTTPNYLKLNIESSKALAPGMRVRARLLDATPQGLYGKWVADACDPQPSLRDASTSPPGAEPDPCPPS
jgi:threonylcarbamoyladenosine tRNA methylthiotransferase MtaB